MVAITVILAAVIGTFVLGLGDQVSDTAPQASFSTDNVVQPDGDLTFNMTKTGGQDIETRDITLAVAGERLGTVDDGDIAEPERDVWQTGQQISFTAEDEDIDLTADERIQIQLIHGPSGDQIYTTTVTVPDEESD